MADLLGWFRVPFVFHRFGVLSVPGQRSGERGVQPEDWIPVSHNLFVLDCLSVEISI